MVEPIEGAEVAQTAVGRESSAAPGVQAAAGLGEAPAAQLSPPGAF